MNQQEFERHYADGWQRMERLLDTLDARKPLSDAEASDFPHQYRGLCQQLALARDRQYASYLIDRLHHLVTRGHRHFYGAQAGGLSRVLNFFGGGFPRLIRAEWRLLLAAFVLFYVSQIAMGVATYYRPELIFTVMDADQVTGFEGMYRPDAPHIGRERGAESDLYMFGFYIYNNIGIGFQTFATGIAAGLGTLFYLLFNGIHLGAVAGYLTQLGYGGTFWPFVIGHGAFEDTAILFAGMAGLKLGFAVLAPGRKRRVQALIDAAKVAVRIVYGMIGMLVIAAFFEAFWSASATIPADVKYAVGGLLWALVFLYFAFVGRHRAA